MLKFTHQFLPHFSPNASTSSFVPASHLPIPIFNSQQSNPSTCLPKSLCFGDTEHSTHSHPCSESIFEENLAKSQLSKQSIELKRQIIKKMNEKIVCLQKKSKNPKMDIFQLEACKNDLLLDFLQYEKNKRKHQEDLAEKQDDFQHNEKSFFFMSSDPQEVQPEEKVKNKINLAKKQEKPMNAVEEENPEVKIKPIQILVPVIKIVDIEIPMLNFGQHKIRQTGTTLPTKSAQEHFAIQNQVNSVYHLEIQGIYCQDNLPLHSSRSLNHGRMLDLGTQRSEQSIDYRKGMKSDRFFVDEEELITNLQEKGQNWNDKLTQRQNYETQNFSGNKINKSFSKGRNNKSLDCSLKQSFLLDELKLNSQISQKQSSKYQQKRLSIDNQTKDFYKNKIDELQEELREKAETIGELLQKNELFVKEICQMNSEIEKKDREIGGSELKIHTLETKVEQLEKYIKQTEEIEQRNSTKLMNEICQLSGEVQAKNEELGMMMDSMEVVSQNAYNKEKQLMCEIQLLENKIHKQKEEIEFYKKRIEHEGVNFDVTDIEIIEEAIQKREKAYESNIEKLQQMYEANLEEMRQNLHALEKEVQQLKQKNTELIVENEKRRHFESSEYMAVKEESIRQIMDLYDGQLQNRDQEIIALKQELAHCNMALIEAIDIIRQNQHEMNKLKEKPAQKNFFKSPHDEMVIQILTEKNKKLEQRLSQELKNRQEMTQKLLKLQKLILSDSTTNSSSNNLSLPQKIDDESQEYELIQALTQELDTLMKQLKKQKQANKKLRQQISEERPCSPTSEAKQIRQLKDKLGKLTKYCQVLESQIKQIYKIDECQAHKKIIQRLENQSHFIAELKKDKIESFIRLVQ